MSGGSHAFFTFKDCIERYLVRGSDEYDGCTAFANGDTLDVNMPEDKRHLQGVTTGLVKIAQAIVRDAHLGRVPTGR